MQQGWEASGGKSVLLDAPGKYIEFTSVLPANRLVLRYSVPDRASGTIGLYVNGTRRADIPVSSARLFEPKFNGAKTVRFFDEVDVEISINSGDRVRIQKGPNDVVPAYHVDLVDLEMAPDADVMPGNLVSVAACGAVANDSLDDLDAIKACLAKAKSENKAGIWFPKGAFNQSDRIKIPDGLIVRGAGMWHTRLIGPKPAETDTSSRVGFSMGNHTKVSDMRLTSGIDTRRFTRMAIGANGVENYTIENLWIEYSNGAIWTHARFGLIRNNRVRLTYADGIHVDHSARDILIENNHVRGAGDDGIAVVSAVVDARNPQSTPVAMNIMVRNNTSVANYWGRGMTAIGGSHLTFTGNLVQDTVWAGMHIATEGAHPQHGLQHVLFERNTIIRAGSIPYFGGSQGGIGVSVRRSDTTATGLKILNNEVRDARRFGISLDNTQYVEGEVKYNTIVNPGGAPIMNQSVSHIEISDNFY